MLDAVIALITTALCSFLVYQNLDKPMLTGIDDENITQVYGRNLANGFGYVYTPNFEHVEGATSPLWVAVHYLLYKISAQPEPYILICSAALTALAIYWALGIARCILAALALPRWALWIPVLAIAAQPNYFHWTVVSMMDQGLWGALVLGLVFVLVRQVSSSEAPERASPLGVALCVLSVLARPESMLLLPLMLTLAGVIVAVNKGVRAALRYVAPYYAAVLLTLTGLTVLRLAYFGYPLPNTYYAKVSSNPRDNIVQGLHYIVWFLNSTERSTQRHVAGGWNHGVRHRDDDSGRGRSLPRFQNASALCAADLRGPHILRSTACRLEPAHGQPDDRPGLVGRHSGRHTRGQLFRIRLDEQRTQRGFYPRCGRQADR
jgi:hypothetical protein